MSKSKAELHKLEVAIGLIKMDKVAVATPLIRQEIAGSVVA